VYVNRFAWCSFIGIEEKLETAMMKDDRHGYYSNNQLANLLEKNEIQVIQTPFQPLPRFPARIRRISSMRWASSFSRPS